MTYIIKEVGYEKKRKLIEASTELKRKRARILFSIIRSKTIAEKESHQKRLTEINKQIRQSGKR